MTMRVDTGEYAHDSCINKARSGQSTDQPDIFAPSISAIESGSSDLSSLEGLLEDK
jgi:hypothetical protein